MERVEGIVQYYEWGDPDAIPDLVGLPSDGRPVAEMWFGTHPSAPARLHDGRRLEAHGGALPFLVKFLAAANALSLQVHPSAIHAVEGFRRENALDLPVSSPFRIYKDPYAKPEILIALSRFEALCGIAEPTKIDALLRQIGEAADPLRRIIDANGVGAAISYILRERPPVRSLQVAAARVGDAQCEWMWRLGLQYPDDPSAAIALLMNYVELQPGQALYLGPGNLHAYLRGTGLEVLASSDNVVRCGLTSKHIDANEVLRVVDTSPLANPIIVPTQIADGGWRYPAPTEEFEVTRYDIDGSVQWLAKRTELVVCVSGTTNEIIKGECAVILRDEEVELNGQATVFRIRSSHSRR